MELIVNAVTGIIVLGCAVYLLVKLIGLVLKAVFYLVKLALCLVVLSLLVCLVAVLVFRIDGVTWSACLAVACVLSFLGVAMNLYAARRAWRYARGSDVGSFLKSAILGIGLASIFSAGSGYSSSEASYSYGSCGGEYTGPNEGYDYRASSDDYARSVGKSYVRNKKTGVIFDVNDPAAKTIGFKHRVYMDEIPYDYESRGYRMKRDA